MDVFAARRNGHHTRVLSFTFESQLWEDSGKYNLITTRLGQSAFLMEWFQVTSRPLWDAMTKCKISMEWVSQSIVRYGSARQLKLPEGRVEPGWLRFAHANCGMYVFRDICTARGSGPTDESGFWWGEVYGRPLLKVSRELWMYVR